MFERLQGRPLLDSEPATKAGVLKLMLEHVDELPAGPAIRQGLAPQIQREIAEASRTQWLPAADGVAIYEAVDAALGEAAVASLAADMVTAAPSRPLFQPLIRGVIHIFGRDPVDLLRAFPQAQKLSNRNCGTCEALVGRPTTVRFQHVPEPLRRRVWQVGQIGVLEAVLALAGGVGTVVIDAPRFASAGAIDFIVHT